MPQRQSFIASNTTGMNGKNWKVAQVVPGRLCVAETVARMLPPYQGAGQMELFSTGKWLFLPRNINTNLDNSMPVVAFILRLSTA